MGWPRHNYKLLRKKSKWQHTLSQATMRPMIREIWKQHPELSLYDISDTGRVRSWATRGRSKKKRADRPTIRSVQRDKRGHLWLSIKDRPRWVHRLMLEALGRPCPGDTFHPTDRPGGFQVRHLDGNPANNTLSNLAWGTAAENAADRASHGNAIRGSKQWKSKLTERQVIEIFDSTEKQATIAARYKIDQSTVSQIRSGKRWGWLTKRE